LFYAAPVHSWRDTASNEWMALNSGQAGGLTVKGTGASSFAGNVGIGNANPTMAKLQVNGSQVAYTNEFAFFAYRKGWQTPFSELAGAGEISKSIWADNRIVGLEFNAFSDVRIKD